MNDVPLGAIIAILGALILVGGGLWRRGIDGNQLMRLAVMWAAIIMVIWAVVSLTLKLR